jgi:two-component system response regulator HydG
MALDLHPDIEYELDDDITLPKPRNASIQHEELSDPAEDLSLEDYFQRFVLEHQEQMTETELAQKLGISRKCLWERRQRLGIPRKKPAAR